MASERIRSGRRRWGSGGAVLLALAAVYSLSYAPYLRYKYGTEDPWPAHWMKVPETPYFVENEHPLYSPVEILIDRTPLRKPLLEWCKLWGMEEKADHDSF